jgi:hypothetical protein
MHISQRKLEKKKARGKRVKYNIERLLIHIYNEFTQINKKSMNNRNESGISA